MDDQFPKDDKFAYEVFPESGAGQEELKAYFTDSEFEQAIENSSKNAVTEYMKAIDPTLSEIQKTGIANFGKELNQNNPPAQ